MRTTTLLNKDWFFKAGFQTADVDTFVNAEYEAVLLPHTVKEVPLNQFDEKLYQGEFCYQQVLPSDFLTALQPGQRAWLHFEGVMACANVYLNGKHLLEHKGGYTPFEIDITDALNQDGDNRLTVAVDTNERPDIPPFGGQIDYLTYGGIYRDVHFYVTDAASIKNIKIETPNALAEKKSVEVEVFTRGDLEDAFNHSFVVELLDEGGNIIAKQERVTEQASAKVTLSELAGLETWSVDSPNLYRIRTTLITKASKDTVEQCFGFRSCEFKTDGFYLNGEKLKIRGVNRHQAWPYLGYAVGNRAQRRDADLLKFEYGMNLVRTSHYPQSKAFIERCDEIGLLVFEEIPGWQHIGDEAWCQQVLTDVEDMIQRDWNHPSIILWGVRINESPDHESLYTRTNALARELDNTRQTGGVRCIEDSQFLEDVFTMNDFVHSGSNEYLRSQEQVTGLDYPVPYLVTEYNGHMFPTKRFDQEERQHEHVMRHLHILNAMYERDDVSGSVGWCFFDYNTHKDFGSGDRVCYHGITDMFRFPKHAAYAYSSQLSPQEKPVLHAVTVWARGERSISGAMPLAILTNCDYIEFQYGDQPVRRIFPDRDTFPHLPYAPVVLDERTINPAELGDWGLAWDGLVIKGFVNDEVVAEQRFAADPIPTALDVIVDDSELSANQKELTRVEIVARDQAGNPMTYWNPVVNLSIEGPGRIVGPQQLALIGGVAGSYIETTLDTGLITFTAEIEGFFENTIEVNVVNKSRASTC